jgi:hypothetical protein
MMWFLSTASGLSGWRSQAVEQAKYAREHLPWVCCLS